MIGITVTFIKIFVQTTDGPFGVEFPLETGLNIIRAENSSGKSTCVNAIAYALGLEAVLGPSRSRPFPKALYDTLLEGKKTEIPHMVLSSYVSIEICNSNGESACVTRDIKGDVNLVKVFAFRDEVTLESGDFFLGTAGKGLGSAISDKGFHNWLAHFIGWELPEVPKYDGGVCPLYIESIFPLFFIEQKRGWSEILANVPLHYGIRNLKRSVIEFCLGIDSFDHETKISEIKNRLDKAESEWNELRSMAIGIADFNTVRVSDISEIEKHDPVSAIEFSYLENGNYINVHDRLYALRKRFKELDSVNIINSDDRYESQASVIRELRRKIETKKNELEMALISLPEIEKKIDVLRNDSNQYRQLKKLKDVGSKINGLLSNKCPICQHEMYDTLGTKRDTESPMTLEENIEFIKNQLDFFLSIKAKVDKDIERCRSEITILCNNRDAEEAKLNAIKRDLDDINGEAKAIIRERILIENAIIDCERLHQSQVDLNNQAERIYTTWTTAKSSLDMLRKSSVVSGRSEKIQAFQEVLRKNLESFGFSHADISTITISHRTLRPEQEGYDIVAETSASDYIRIIWSYILSLLELAAKDASVRHGGFVVFDEPRQHETNMISFIGLIDKAAQTIKFGGQVIFATSLPELDLREACIGKSVSINCFDDYILERLPPLLEADGGNAQSSI